MIEPNAEYDSPWKEALGDYFESFLTFFFPQVYSLIDWSQPPQSLEKELQQIAPASESGSRVADKLFQVWLRDKREVWVLVHIEVQSQEESKFAQRMYIYSYRAFDLYQRPVISLAVLGDERKNWRPSSYGWSLGGCELSLKFPIVKLLDYQAQWQNLEQNTNPFAVIIMAHLKTKATTGKPQEREQWKWSLARGLYDRGYDREKIIKLFQVIDRMMALPQELQQSFEDKLTRYEEERQMPLLSRMEERGLEQGTRQGLEQGTRQTLQSNIIRILQIRFEIVSTELINAINSLNNISELQRLLVVSVTTNSIADFEQILSQLPQITETNED
ncbi:MAG TPA: transposase [Cyanobacteria bacterium UBA11162]|nr:transposase [Cyanobacteria bacterium UBA11162]